MSNVCDFKQTNQILNLERVYIFLYIWETQEGGLTPSPPPLFRPCKSTTAEYNTLVGQSHCLLTVFVHTKSTLFLSGSNTSQ